MAFNGSGVFQRLYNWVNDKNNNIKINSTRVDAEMDGMATGLSNCICRDGQSVILANIPMAGFKFTGLGAGSSRGDSVNVGQLADGAITWCGSTGGTANAITLTPVPAILAYSAGQRFQALITTANTGASTGAISGLTTKNILKSIGGALVSLAPNDMPLGKLCDFDYDGTELVLLNPAPHTHCSDIASAATLNLDTATGDYVVVTGTTGVTAITLADGREATTKFSGIVAITNGASLIAPGGASYTTAAGDVIKWRGEASGVVRAVTLLRADGSAIIAAGSVTFAKLDAQVVNDATTVTIASGDYLLLGDVSDSNKVKKGLVSDITAGALAVGSQADMEAATSNTVAASPGRMQYHPGVSKSWVKFSLSGGTPTINVSYNVTSLTDNGVGDWTVNFTTSFSSAHHCSNVTSASKSGGATAGYFGQAGTQASGSCQVFTCSTNASGVQVLADADQVYASFKGDQ